LRKRIALFLVAALAAAIVMAAGPTVGWAEAKPRCVIAKAGGATAWICDGKAVANAGGTRAVAPRGWWGWWIW
jgi:hypothetical protein